MFPCAAAPCAAIRACGVFPFSTKPASPRAAFLRENMESEISGQFMLALGIALWASCLMVIAKSFGSSSATILPI